MLRRMPAHLAHHQVVDVIFLTVSRIFDVILTRKEDHEGTFTLYPLYPLYRQSGSQDHFIDLFLIKQTTKLDTDLPQYAFIIHGSAGEYTGDNKSGFGLYYDKSDKLMNMTEEMVL